MGNKFTAKMCYFGKKWGRKNLWPSILVLIKIFHLLVTNFCAVGKIICAYYNVWKDFLLNNRIVPLQYNNLHVYLKKLKEINCYEILSMEFFKPCKWEVCFTLIVSRKNVKLTHKTIPNGFMFYRYHEYASYTLGHNTVY